MTYGLDVGAMLLLTAITQTNPDAPPVQPPREPATQPIRLGMSATLSGPSANHGLQVRRGVQAGGRLCYLDEVTQLYRDGNIIGDAVGNQPIWIDGGEGNQNHQESGFYTHYGRPDDWEPGAGLANACCRRIA